MPNFRSQWCRQRRSRGMGRLDCLTKFEAKRPMLLVKKNNSKGFLLNLLFPFASPHRNRVACLSCSLPSSRTNRNPTATRNPSRHGRRWCKSIREPRAAAPARVGICLRRTPGGPERDAGAFHDDSHASRVAVLPLRKSQRALGRSFARQDAGPLRLLALRRQASLRLGGRGRHHGGDRWECSWSADDDDDDPHGCLRLWI